METVIGSLFTGQTGWLILIAFGVYARWELMERGKRKESTEIQLASNARIIAETTQALETKGEIHVLKSLQETLMHEVQSLSAKIDQAREETASFHKCIQKRMSMIETDIAVLKVQMKKSPNGLDKS